MKLWGVQMKHEDLALPFNWGHGLTVSRLTRAVMGSEILEEPAGHLCV